MDKLVIFLKDRGFTEEGVQLFLLTLQPLMSEYLSIKIMDGITDDEMMEIQRQSNENDLNTLNKVDVIDEFYKMKNGKGLADLTSEFIDNFITEIKKNEDTLAGILNSDNPEDEKIKNIQGFIEQELQEMKSLNI